MKSNILFAGCSLASGRARFHTAVREDTCLAIPLPGTVTYTMVKLPKAMNKLEAVQHCLTASEFKDEAYQTALKAVQVKLTPKPKAEKPAKVEKKVAAKAKTEPKKASAAVEKLKETIREANKQAVAAKKK